MGDGFQYLDIILLAMIAAFIALRLRSVLGRRTGNEQPNAGQGDYSPSPEAKTGAGEDESLDQDLEESPTIVPVDSPAYEALRRIHDRDRNFNLDGFVNGGKAAYHMILEAFWTGVAADLKPLVSGDVFAQFESAIRAREAAGRNCGNKLVGIEKVEIPEATLDGNIARITLKYVSDIILVTRDSENRVIEGDVTDAVVVTDIWTYERDLTRDDPNWILVATRSGASSGASSGE